MATEQKERPDVRKFPVSRHVHDSVIVDSHMFDSDAQADGLAISRAVVDNFRRALSEQKVKRK